MALPELRTLLFLVVPALPA